MTQVHVTLPMYLRPYAEGAHAVRVSPEGERVRDVLEALFARYPGLRDRLFNERGEVRPHVNIFVGSEAIRFLDGLDTVVPEDETVTLLPAVSGGSAGG